jgi:hypothetical protein
VIFLDDAAPNVDAALTAGLKAILYEDNAQAITDIEAALSA